MDHLLKFNLNRMVNKPRNTVSRKLRILEKSVVPNAQKLGTWRLAV